MLAKSCMKSKAFMWSAGSAIRHTCLEDCNWKILLQNQARHYWKYWLCCKSAVVILEHSEVWMQFFSGVLCYQNTLCACPIKGLAPNKSSLPSVSPFSASDFVCLACRKPMERKAMQETVWRGHNMLPLRRDFENKFTCEARREKHKTWCNNHRVKFNSLNHPRGQAQW